MKQQRKIMQIYQMHYAFREPYQVLITSDCLRALHAFAMPIQKFLENTLHGKLTPYITQCTLAKVMEGYSGKGRDGRPAYLPPPLDVPLRFCKQKDGVCQERGAIPEAECLIDLISGQAKGNEQKKNKNHYIIAAADWDEGIKDQREWLAKEFDGAGWQSERVVKGMWDDEEFYMQQIAQVKMPEWYKGRVALVGDAGYCPSPISGVVSVSSTPRYTIKYLSDYITGNRCSYRRSVCLSGRTIEIP